MKANKSLKSIAIAGLIVSLAACLRLDDNLFNPNTRKITAYTFDNYTGEVDFKLDPAYKIPDSLIHLITLASKSADEPGPTKIFGVYIGNIKRIAFDTVIMYCHGNRDHMDFYWQRAKLLANAGGKNRFGVLMIDYRGYGLSEGKPSENGLYADVDEGLQWLKMNGLTDSRLIIYGFSMGSAPATKLSATTGKMRPAKLMLEAPFASAEVIVQDATGLALPGSFATDLKINNAEQIKQVQQPFFWIHGIDDNYLNIATTGELVYKNHRGTYKEAHRIARADHSNVPNTMGYQNYLKAVTDFITR